MRALMIAALLAAVAAAAPKLQTPAFSVEVTGRGPILLSHRLRVGQAIVLVACLPHADMQTTKGNGLRRSWVMPGR